MNSINIYIIDIMPNFYKKSSQFNLQFLSQIKLKLILY